MWAEMKTGCGHAPGPAAGAEALAALVTGVDRMDAEDGASLVLVECAGVDDHAGTAGGGDVVSGWRPGSVAVTSGPDRATA